MWVQSGCRLWLCLPDVWRVCWWQACQLSGLSSLSGAVLSFRGAFLPPIVAYFQPEQGETWQKLDFICSLWCFLGDLGDNKVRNLNIFLKYGVCVWCRVCLSWWCSSVSTGGICAGFRTFRTCRRWLWSSGVVCPPFCPLYCFMLIASLANMLLFRVLRGFLEGFICLVWVCLSCVLFVACVGFVRVNS